jgi:hypothetical protein
MVALTRNSAKIFSNLKVGADINSSQKLKANSDLACRGMEMRGAGFLINHDDAERLGYKESSIQKVIKPFISGRDITARSRGLYTIDLFGLSISQVQESYPSIYQWVLEKVKPERDVNRAPRKIARAISI